METQKIQGCPSPERLRGLLAGELAASDQDAVTRHIESCPSCQQMLDGWLSSPSIEGLAAAGKDSATQEAALRELMDDIKKKSVGDMTQAESTDPRGESLAYLTPSAKPGHLGRLGQYEILSIIGKGGFGTVFKSFDDKLHRMVAIKVLAPELAVSGTARKRFIREAQAAAAVKSDHIVAIYNVADEANPPYLVMELIDGISLEDRLKEEGALDLKEILRIGMQMAEGLAAAHKQGLIHRDIKPGNILLENGVQRVKITDFGLARAADDASVTQSGVIAGTPMFMAPEQAMGEKLDHRADLFSLGSVLYVMCTGRAPFRASTTMAVLKRVCDETPTPIREINPDVPDWLCAIVEKLQAKKVEDRFASAKEVAELLGKHLADVQAHGRGVERAASVSERVEPAEPVVHASSSPGKRAAIAAALLAVVAIVLAVIYWPKSGGDVVPPEKKEIVENKSPVVPIDKKENDAWVQLFNGKDLTGWKTHPDQPGDWRVDKEGTITCSGINGSHLFHTGKEYQDFHLRATTKINATGDSGLIFRCPYDLIAVSGSNLQKQPPGYEAQIMNVRVGMLVDVSVGKNPAFLSKGLPFPAEEWLELELIVQGNRLQTKVNGRLVQEVNRDSHRSGFIAVQHANAKTSVHFRKIEIKELPPTPAAPTPFVVLAKADRKEMRHPTLAAAVAAAQSGDTIEIRGDGPFLMAPLSLGKNALTIRAGNGFLPHLKHQPTDPKSNDPLLRTEGPLVLEGLILERGANPEAKVWTPLSTVVHAKDAPIRLANCRVIGRRVFMGLILGECPEAIVTNCEILGFDDCHGYVGIWPSESSRIMLENNLLLGRWHSLGLHLNPKDFDNLDRASVRLERNTIWANFALGMHSNVPADSPRLANPGQSRLRLEAESNVFIAKSAFLLGVGTPSGALVDAPTWLTKKLALEDAGNLYSLEWNTLLSATRMGEKNVSTIGTLQDWHKLWGIAKSESKLGTPAFEGGDVLARTLANSTGIAVDNFRLAPGSPGKGAGPGGTDLGADVDLVGPGAAYERWKKTPEYQEWRKAIDLLLSR